MPSLSTFGMKTARKLVARFFFRLGRMLGLSTSDKCSDSPESSSVRKLVRMPVGLHHMRGSSWRGPFVSADEVRILPRKTCDHSPNRAPQQGREAVTRQAHNLEIEGATPSPATGSNAARVYIFGAERRRVRIPARPNLPGGSPVVRQRRPKGHEDSAILVGPFFCGECVQDLQQRVAGSTPARNIGSSAAEQLPPKTLPLSSPRFLRRMQYGSTWVVGSNPISVSRDAESPSW